MDKQQPNDTPSPKNPVSASPGAVLLPSASGGGDRLKRDEWSEGAVSTLLEAYESKWILRNRAKLKGHDWEDVAKYVSSRANSTKLPKTQTQCKNKIESMKKRYRSESASGDVSSWPLFQRLDLLAVPVSTAMMMVQSSSSVPNSVDSNGVDRENKEEVVVTKVPDGQQPDKMDIESDCSTPALYTESIRWLAKVMVKSEQAKAETMRELEKMRADADIKRSEIDLKRTEIIAHTQLEIAKLFAASLGKNVDPSLRIGRS
ncbi:sequence-specific DNA binding transcription factor [Artemisia annua]|uniref:Sequence-specific DNA binding transcription factor n=1 Tax=Artemisia annua TaxID=35608 RepID=A0A2U1P7B2_ARTAN|nr:sequence-specific DNA binding transcription factor [Artemisia annua]